MPARAAHLGPLELDLALLLLPKVLPHHDVQRALADVAPARGIVKPRAADVRPGLDGLGVLLLHGRERDERRDVADPVRVGRHRAVLAAGVAELGTAPDVHEGIRARGTVVDGAVARLAEEGRGVLVGVVRVDGRGVAAQLGIQGGEGLGVVARVELAVLGRGVLRVALGERAAQRVEARTPGGRDGPGGEGELDDFFAWRDAADTRFESVVDKSHA